MDAVAPTRTRLAMAAAIVAVMLCIACVCMGVAFAFAAMSGFDGGDPTAGRLVGLAAAISAVALYLGTGPTAYLISRRRWTIATPIGIAALAAVAIVVASIT